MKCKVQWKGGYEDAMHTFLEKGLFSQLRFKLRQSIPNKGRENNFPETSKSYSLPTGILSSQTC